MTGIEIIGDLARGDFGSAVANTALAVLPIAGGWMDDLGGLRYAPDDLPGGGGLASGADEAVDAARQVARASNTPLSQTAPAGAIGSADAQIANASAWWVGPGNEFYDRFASARSTPSLGNWARRYANLAQAHVSVLDANGNVINEFDMVAISGNPNTDMWQRHYDNLVDNGFSEQSIIRLGNERRFEYVAAGNRGPESTRVDTEAQILEELAARSLSENHIASISIPPGGTIRIDMYTELHPCESCGGRPMLSSESMMGQFISEFNERGINIDMRVQYAWNRAENRTQSLTGE